MVLLASDQNLPYAAPVSSPCMLLQLIYQSAEQAPNIASIQMPP